MSTERVIVHYFLINLGAREAIISAQLNPALLQPGKLAFQTSIMPNYILHSLIHYLFIISLVAGSTLLFLIVFVFTVSSLKGRREHGIIPKDLPWSGRQQGQILASIRANYRGLVDSVHLFKEGYRKVITT